jgi:enolase
MMNVISGEKHAGNDLSLQEFMVIPTGFTRRFVMHFDPAQKSIMSYGQDLRLELARKGYPA